MVVNKPDMIAFCIPGGRIVVFTGLLEHFGTDEEIATIIGHEMANVDLILLVLIFDRIELEADYIGLMLLASAGYDPRVAPKALEKLDQFTGDKMNPSVKERAQLLAQAKVMEEALAIYTETRSGY
ncbi:hypothetical protein LWI29_036304 [Acer saccharum]|uniref:Peptidase M48 domain-containing protein n=1 Tax=Acer saccharum TaxID=4024 RepID=A0AA39SW99_ACESA|nr:hypothetical protein LWI29_036304 [Acer saccharum]